MKQTHRKISGGLRLMWIGECVVFAWTIVYSLTNILGYLTLDTTRAGAFIVLVSALVGLVGTLAGLVGVVVGIVGLWRLRREHRDYKIALVILAAAFVCGMLMPRNPRQLASILILLPVTLLGLLEIYLVIRATNSFLSGVKREPLRTEGKRALWARIATALISLVSSILTGLLLEGTVRVLTHVAVTEAAMIVSETLYLTYLKHSSEALA